MGYFKKNWIEISTILIALIALICSYRANSIANEASSRSAQTYISVSSSPLPFEVPVLGEIAKELKIKNGDTHYVALLGNSKDIRIWAAFDVKNAGSIEARDVVFEIKFEFESDYSKEISDVFGLYPNVGKFEIGDLAPGDAIVQDVLIELGIPDPSNKDDFPGHVFQESFKDDLFRILFTTTVSYTDASGERRISGRLKTFTRNGGSWMGIGNNRPRPYNLKKITNE